MPQASQLVMRTRAIVGRLASRVYPGLDEALWTRKREREMRAEIEAGGYASALLGLSAPAESALRSSNE